MPLAHSEASPTPLKTISKKAINPGKLVRETFRHIKDNGTYNNILLQ